LKLSLAVGFL